ncbi:hypothetical protein ONZ45_g2745 [Pleurotus djamor]|nr:hypothetical protein ONZ45_g2745 [Pleurotus djamor]
MPLLTDYDAQDRIDKELDFHRSAIQRLSSRRNELSAINQLPVDILSHVFVIYKEMFDPFKESDDKDAGSNMKGGWKNVLCICAHWRTIILDTPRFWTSVALSPVSIFPSLNPPDGHLRDTFNDRELEVVEEFISENSSRFRRLFMDFECATYYEIDDLLSMMPHDLKSSLHFLKLRLNPVGSNPYPEMGIVRPFTLNRGLMASLRTLELVNVVFPLDCPHMPHLETLLVTVPHDEPVSFDWVVGLLRHTPNVEFVTLEFVDGVVSAQTPSAQVPLPSLRVLNIRSTHPSSPDLLKVLEMPLESVKITHNNFGSINQYYLSALATFCTTFISAQPDLAAFNLSMDHSNGSITLSPLDGDNASSAPALTLGLPYTLIPQLLRFDSPDWLDQVLALSVQANPPTYMRLLTEPGWGDILRLFTNLHSLEFADCDLSIVTHHLLPSKNDRLDKLSFTGIRVDGCASFEVHDLMTSLFKFFDKRKEDGNGIRKLIIRRSNIPSQYIDAFSKYVEVDWDGVE